MTDPSDALLRLVHLVDDLEGRATGYVTLDQVHAAATTRQIPEATVQDALREEVLLQDQRDRLLPEGGWQQVTLCRLNRHHPQVRQALA